MRRAPRSGLWLSIVIVSIAAACGPKRISPPVSVPVRQGQSLAVLLPDAHTSTTGAAQVSNTFGSVDLDEDREAATTTPGEAPVLNKLTEEEVQRIFGAALSALPPPARQFTLFFRFESDELTDQSKALIPEILAVVKQHAVQDVVVIGHTDTMGTQQANYALGLKRAMVVRSFLVDAGLDGSNIDVTSVGELDLFVKTPDETPEPRNRRVDISVR
jgi:outer membrane protein OmpA-like peptidoglycan-associated protein